jgi:two-component system, cell cycle sensor histidine kinase PleC
MFNYLRLFSIGSLIIIVVATMVAGNAFHAQSIDDITRLTEKNNASIAQGYVEAVWRSYQEKLKKIGSMSPEELRSDEEIRSFAHETVRYFKRMPILRVNIYSSSGALLLTSTVNASVTLNDKDSSPDKQFILSQLRGTAVSSQTLNKVTLAGGEEGRILQTLVPIQIRAADGSSPGSEGVVEMLYDMSTTWNRFSMVRNVGTGGIISTFILFLLMLMVMSRRAEGIITKQHEANIELAAAAASAQAESKDKSQFLANVSHELRTPLNAIIGFSEIIKNTTIEDLGATKFQEYIHDINSSGVHLLSLINDILDFSKAEAGKLEVEVSEMNANKLVYNCVRLVTPRAEAAQVSVIEALPKEPLNMVCDSKKFKQILLNLLSNAVKFTPPGGEVKVSAWAEMATDSYVFEVRDSGIGIAPKDIARAMSPFGQVDSTLSRKYDGTGLGLPLTKKFVELMGGEFAIESEVGKGTTIRFSLPRIITEREGLVVKHVG